MFPTRLAVCLSPLRTRDLISHVGSGFRRRLTLLVVLTCCCLNAASVFAQEKPEEKEEENSSPAHQHEVNKVLWGPKLTKEIEDFERDHPGTTAEDYFVIQRENAELEQRGQEFKKDASGLLKPKDSAGWSIEREVSVQLNPTAHRTVRAYSPYGGAGYLLVEMGLKFIEPTVRLENTIMLDSSYREVSDLTRFFQVNNQLLKDAHLLPKDSVGFAGKKVSGNPELAHSEVVAITGAHLSNGVEIVTVFDLRKSTKTGALHGDMVVIPSRIDYAPSRMSTHKDLVTRVDDILSNPTASGIDSALGDILRSGPRRRVYYYGDELQNLSIRKLVETSGHEFIQRSPELSHDLLGTNRRLQELESRPFGEDKLTVVNGLPDDPHAVATMGPLAGDAAAWLDFRNKVVETLSGHKAQIVASREDFVSELMQGENDVIVLVAHSTGAYLYLNGERMSIEDLKALPARKTPSPRPRLAVLVSCETGKLTSDGPRWRNWFKKQTAPLAQILVEKRYVDKVVAPDHNIRVEESLIVLQRALEGARTTSIFKDWINWAAVKLGLPEFLGLALL